jgi:hypothetical protein
MSPRRVSFWFALFLVLAVSLSTCALGQSEGEAKAAKSEAPALPSTTTLSKNFPVVTAKGPCPKSAASKTAPKSRCMVTLGREEFEALVNSLNPDMVKGERRVLAAAYGKALALALEATRRGLDRDPRVQAQLHYNRLILLANAMSKELYKDAMASPEEDAEKYYAVHKSLFERFTFDRIYIPLEKQPAAPEQGTVAVPAAQENDLQQKEMKELAEKVYARAQAGEDFDKLQKEAAQTAGMATDPNIKVEDLRRGDLSDVQNVIFDLQPGKISGLLTDNSGYFIYKLVSRIAPPFETVKPQVTVRMQNDKSASGISQIEKMSDAEVNSAYFDKYDPPPPAENEGDMDSD